MLEETNAQIWEALSYDSTLTGWKGGFLRTPLLQQHLSTAGFGGSEKQSVMGNILHRQQELLGRFCISSLFLGARFGLSWCCFEFVPKPSRKLQKRSNLTGDILSITKRLCQPDCMCVCVLRVFACVSGLLKKWGPPQRTKQQPWK